MRPVRRGCRWLGLILWLPAAASIANRRVTGAVVYGHPQSKYHVNGLECTAAMLDCDHTAPDSSGLKPRAAIAVQYWMPSRDRLARGQSLELCDPCQSQRQGLAWRFTLAHQRMVPTAGTLHSCVGQRASLQNMNKPDCGKQWKQCWFGAFRCKQ